MRRQPHAISVHGVVGVLSIRTFSGISLGVKSLRETWGSVLKPGKRQGRGLFDCLRSLFSLRLKGLLTCLPTCLPTHACSHWVKVGQKSRQMHSIIWSDCLKICHQPYRISCPRTLRTCFTEVTLLKVDAETVRLHKFPLGGETRQATRVARVETSQAHASCSPFSSSARRLEL